MYIDSITMEVVTISGYDKEDVVNSAKEYAKKHDYKFTSRVYRKLQWLKLKWEYKIYLYKSINIHL